MNKQYSFVKTVEKGLLSFAVFAIPFFISKFPDIANLTIGGLLVGGLNYLKHRNG